MESYTRGKLGIMSCDSGRPFAEKVIAELKLMLADEGASDSAEIIKTKETKFANTELKTEIGESIRNRDVYIFQDLENKEGGLSVNDNFMVLKTAIQSANLADAHYITAVIPAFPYARQDKPKTREGITAALAAWELESAGATRVLTLDVHNDAIAGFFRKAKLENLHASKNIMDYLKEKIGIKDLIIVAPDAGAAERAVHYAKKLGTPVALLHKERDYSKVSTVENVRLVGDVNGKKVFVVDDIIDTAGTMLRSAQKLKEAGAKEIYFAASLCLFNGPAIDRINSAHKEKLITKIIGTDAVYHGEGFAKNNPWYDEVSVAKYFARVIYNINKGISISRLLD
ncbi:ribose-phosphate pyrophosphokinase [Candidatus Woesearchaeota archaeon]|nr:ribose-phosphate pyrophosphokinase [Candidatus Woesearchaeota archaeon]